jgi:hypothetical protein
VFHCQQLDVRTDKGLFSLSDMHATKMQTKTPNEPILRLKTVPSLQNDHLETFYSHLEDNPTEIKTQVGNMPHQPPDNNQHQGVFIIQHVS